MDSLFGIVGADFVILVSDTSTTRSVLRMAEDEDKIMILDHHKLLASAGPHGDRTHFTEFIQRNVKLYKYRNNIDLNNHATANFIRNELAESLRSAPYQVNLLFAGFDKEGPALYWLDYLGAMCKVEFSAHGYCAYYLLSIMDRYYRKGLNLEEALDIVEKCTEELRKRFVINSPKFIIKIVDKEGARLLHHPDTGFVKEPKDKMKE
jgi:20S proteasome subunit beta 4